MEQDLGIFSRQAISATATRNFHEGSTTRQAGNQPAKEKNRSKGEKIINSQTSRKNLNMAETNCVNRHIDRKQRSADATIRCQ